MKRLLFVDDEPLVLDGLRNVLHRRRSDWHMSFVTSGDAALAALAEFSPDVVVADMRMPGMDGAELLARTRERYPQTARVILTGQASEKELLCAVQVSQQILSKPCDPARLRETLERLFEVRTLIADARVHALVGGIDRLPLLPASYRQLCPALGRDNVTTAEILRIVERDPALSGKALAMANATLFGFSKPSTSITEAVRRVGFRLLRSLAQPGDALADADDETQQSSTLARLPEATLHRAQLAWYLLPDPVQAEEAFTAALLLEVGYVVFAKTCGSAYLDLLERASVERRPVQELEQECFGFTHAQVGAYLLGLWGLPVRLVELIAAHHDPVTGALLEDPVATAVRIAGALISAEQAGSAGQPDVLSHLGSGLRERPEVAARLASWQARADLRVAAS